MTDCLIVGYNDGSFEEEVKRMKAMGEESISFKDFNLGFITHQNKNYRALDALTHFHYKDKAGQKRVFHNADVLWQVIMYLGTYLTRNGLNFDYVNLFHFQKEKLREKLEKEDITAIVVTTTIYVSVHPILEVVDFIRKYNKTAKIIVGGPYISKQCEEVDVSTNQSMFKLIDADFYVNSLEGEKTIVQLLKEIKGKGRYELVDNIAYRDGDDYIFTSTSREGNSLEENMIDFSLFPTEDIGKTVNIRTSKSCPFSCAYCGFPLRAEKYSYISVERIEKELNSLKQLNCIEYINFIDDTFNIPKNRFKDILRMMIRNKYKFKWYSFYRCDFGDEETIRLMKEAGCIGVFLGVESANDDILKNMNKTSRVKDYLKAINTLQEEGILIFASTIIGFPGETYHTAKQTMDFIEDTKPDFFRPQIFWSDPLTPIWQKRDGYGLKGLGFNWVHNTMDAKTAYDIFEETFLSVENSIWVPDPGFNAYGMYYLLERGMSIEQVKIFLKCFNSIVKQKILFPNQTDIPTDLLKSFSSICKYDEAKQPDMKCIDMLSGFRYKKAKEYWLEQLNEVKSDTKKKFSGALKLLQVKSVVLEPSQYNNLKAQDFTAAFLTAYSILISKLFISESVCIAVLPAGERLTPMLLKLDDNDTIQNFMQAVSCKLENGIRHNIYGFNILKSHALMKQQDCSCPAFEFAYIEDAFDNDSIGWDAAAFTMRIIKSTANIKIEFTYMEEALDADTANQIGEYFAAVLETVKLDKQVLIKDVSVSRIKKVQQEAWINDLKNQEFNF